MKRMHSRLLQYAPNGTYYINLPADIVRDLDLKKRDRILFTITRNNKLLLERDEEQELYR